MTVYTMLRLKTLWSSWQRIKSEVYYERSRPNTSSEILLLSTFYSRLQLKSQRAMDSAPRRPAFFQMIRAKKSPVQLSLAAKQNSDVSARPAYQKLQHSHPFAHPLSTFLASRESSIHNLSVPQWQVRVKPLPLFGYNLESGVVGKWQLSAGWLESKNVLDSWLNCRAWCLRQKNNIEKQTKKATLPWT